MKITKHITRTLLAATLLLPAMPILAETAQPKITIAVYKIQANNCPAEVARAVEELMISRLYSTSLFLLMEKSQMDRIAQNNGFKDFDTTNAAQVAKLGKILNVEKIIVGSVNKVGSYKLEIRSIDVKTGAVDITVPYDADDEEELNKAISKTADTLERYYLGYDRISGKWDITFAGSILYPLGAIGDGVSYGYGATFTGSLNNIFADNFNLHLMLGAYKFQPDNAKIKSLYITPCQLYAAYRVPLSRTFSWTPSVGTGIIYSASKFDEDGVLNNGRYSYINRKFINFSLDLRSEFSFFVYDRWLMIVVPSIGIAQGNIYSFLPGLSLGVKTIF